MKQGALLATAALGAVAIGVAVAAGRRAKKARRATYPQPKPKLVYGMPMASGTGSPMWPLYTNRKATVSYVDVDGKFHGAGGRRFATTRGTGGHHAGMDLYADVGDIVVATEPGVVSNIWPFFHGAWSIYVCTDSGLTINYGEVKKNSQKEFGIKKGSRVVTGQPIARIGVMSGGSHMLHFEAYKTCRKGNQRWKVGQDPKPTDLLNPSDYLLRAAQRLPREAAVA